MGLARSGLQQRVRCLPGRQQQRTVDGIDPGSAGYSAAVAKRALSIFKCDQTAGARSEITVNAGQRLGLFLIQNGKTGTWQQQNPNNVVGQGPIAFFSFDAANPDKFDHVRATPFANNSQTFSWEDLLNGGDKDYNDAVIRVNLGRKDPLRVTGTTSQTIPTTFNLESRAQTPRGEVGVIVTDDASGKIGSLLPGQDGYVAAALANRQTLFSPTQNAPASTTVNLPGASNLLYYLIDNGTAATFLQQNPSNRQGNGPLAYFSSFAASPDGIDHVRFLGNNRIGFEDGFCAGDGDYDDVILNFSFGTPISNNLPPVVTAKLLNDTTGAQGTNTDKISSDVSTELTVTDDGTVANVRVGIDNLAIANYVDVTSLRQPNGKINLDQAFFNSIGAPNVGAVLSQGRTPCVSSPPTTPTSRPLQLDFTFDSTTNVPTAGLDPASDTGVAGDRITNLAQVIIKGIVEPNALVRVDGQSAQATADGLGSYTLSNVTLQPGVNALVIRSTDRAGNTAQTNLEVTRDSQQPDVSVQLVTDTTGPGGTNSDRISSNPASTGTITDNRAVTSLRAGIDTVSDAALIDVLAQLQPNGTVNFTQTLLNQLAGELSRRVPTLFASSRGCRRQHAGRQLHLHFSIARSLRPPPSSMPPPTPALSATASPVHRPSPSWVRPSQFAGRDCRQPVRRRRRIHKETTPLATSLYWQDSTPSLSARPTRQATPQPSTSK